MSREKKDEAFSELAVLLASYGLVQKEAIDGKDRIGPFASSAPLLAAWASLVHGPKMKTRTALDVLNLARAIISTMGEEANRRRKDLLKRLAKWQVQFSLMGSNDNEYCEELEWHFSQAEIDGMNEIADELDAEDAVMNTDIRPHMTNEDPQGVASP